MKAVSVVSCFGCRYISEQDSSPLNLMWCSAADKREQGKTCESFVTREAKSLTVTFRKPSSPLCQSTMHIEAKEALCLLIFRNMLSSLVFGEGHWASISEGKSHGPRLHRCRCLGHVSG